MRHQLVLLFLMIAPAGCFEDEAPPMRENPSPPPHRQRTETVPVTKVATKSDDDGLALTTLSLSYLQSPLFDSAVEARSGIWINKDEQTKAPPFKTNGKVEAAVHWRDSTGDNILILTHTGTRKSPRKDCRDCHDAQLFGYHYRIDGNDTELVRRFTDHQLECQFDLELEFFKKGVTITDLDDDGIAEFTVAYKKTCRSDVSPAEMKVLLFEDGEKYALRGLMTFDLKEMGFTKKAADEIGLGKFTKDPSFKTAPKQFPPFAISRWNKHKVERF